MTLAMPPAPSMTLLNAPRSPFAMKVRVAISELGLSEAVEISTINPWKDENLRTRNPLCKVPTLVLADGTALFDSPVICEYLDQGPRRIIPESGPRRWQALRRQTMGDGLAEAVVRRFVERLGPPNARSDEIASRQEAAITATLDLLDAEAASFEPQPTVGEIAIAAALIYLGFRSPELAWRQDRPALASWFDTVAARPSFATARIPPAPPPI